MVVSAFVVRVPVTRLFPAIVIVASAPNTKDGVKLDVIVLCRVKFPFIVSVRVARLFQFTFVVGVNCKLVTVPVKKDTVAPPVLPTYTFGTKVVAGPRVNVPVPEPVKYAFVEPNWLVKVRVFAVAELLVMYRFVIAVLRFVAVPGVNSDPVPVKYRSVAVIALSPTPDVDMFPIYKGAEFIEILPDVNVRIVLHVMGLAVL